LDAKIEEQTRPWAGEIERLDAVPGVDRCAAAVVLAEVGAQMTPFPSHQDLASWAGMCPGNEESAGKTEAATHHPGESLAETDLGASRLGREP
jgi:transposase